MSSNDVERHLGSTLAALGFRLDEIDPDLVYGERPAWAVLYCGPDCKLQVCWLARDGGVDFMLAPLGAPNEFGLDNRSTKWRFMLAVSDATDDWGTPPLRAGSDAVWAWSKALSRSMASSLTNTSRRLGSLGCSGFRQLSPRLRATPEKRCPCTRHTWPGRARRCDPQSR
jgi:hypothetical protein